MFCMVCTTRDDLEKDDNVNRCVKPVKYYVLSNGLRFGFPNVGIRKWSLAEVDAKWWRTFWTTFRPPGSWAGTPQSELNQNLHMTEYLHVVLIGFISGIFRLTFQCRRSGRISAWFLFQPSRTYDLRANNALIQLHVITFARLFGNIYALHFDQGFTPRGRLWNSQVQEKSSLSWSKWSCIIAWNPEHLWLWILSIWTRCNREEVRVLSCFLLDLHAVIILR